MLPDSEEEWHESSRRGHIPFPLVGVNVSVTYVRHSYVDAIVDHIIKLWLSPTKKVSSKAERKESNKPDVLILGIN